VNDLVTGGFEAWKRAYPPPVHADNPLPLKPESVFLYESLVMQGSGAPSGWQWFDSTRHLAAYLLYVGMPDLASWWFELTAALDSRGRIPLRDTVESATVGNPEDRAFFLAIADDLEALLADDDPVSFEAIALILERFNIRFGEGHPRPEFKLTAFPDTVSAGAALLEWDEDLTHPETGDELHERQWLELCAQAGKDPDATRAVVEVFSNALTV
jgi:hypothetical protein